MKKQKSSAHINSIFNDLFVLGTTILLVLCFVWIAILFLLVERSDSIRKKENTKKEELKYWLEVSDKFHSSPDVLYNVAVAAYKTNDKKMANEYLNKALLVDGSFQKAKELKNLLEN